MNIKYYQANELISQILFDVLALRQMRQDN